MKLTKKNLIIAAALAIASNASGQVQRAYAMDEPTFVITHQDITKSSLLDSSRIDITYHFRCRSAESDDSLKNEDDMTLLIGKDYVSFFSKNLRDLDSANTVSLKTTMTMDTPENGWQGYDIMRDVKAGIFTVSTRIPFSEEVAQYTETVPSIDWQFIPGDTATIIGYHCHAVEGEYGGRKWKAYYTNSIPLSYGPWKLCGANGVILKAFDESNNFVFEAEGITKRPQAIVRYDWKYRTMTKEEWQDFEQNIYDKAGAFVKGTGARVLIMDNSEKGFHQLEDSWKAYYNPLEKK